MGRLAPSPRCSDRTRCWSTRLDNVLVQCGSGPTAAGHDAAGWVGLSMRPMDFAESDPCLALLLGRCLHDRRHVV